MEKEVVDRTKSRARGVDVGFWEEVLNLLRPKMARTRLKELHTKKMKRRLEQIRAEQKKATEKHEKDHNISFPSTSTRDLPTNDETSFEVVDVKPTTDDALDVSVFVSLSCIIGVLFLGRRSRCNRGLRHVQTAAF